MRLNFFAVGFHEFFKMRLTLLVLLGLFCYVQSAVQPRFEKKTRMSTFSLLLQKKLWTDFFKSFKIIESYKKDYKSNPKESEADRIRIIRPQKINDPVPLELMGVIHHSMDNVTKINITVKDGEENTNFTLNVGTTTSSCKEFPEPMGKTCFRAGDYRIYSDHGPKLVHQCILAFWPTYRSGGRFCYKMYKSNKKISLNFNNVIVSAAGDNEQAVYLPVVEREQGWKVLKFHEDNE